MADHEGPEWERDSDVDLPSSLVVSSIAIIGGLFALSYSPTVAMLFFFGLMIAYAIWQAIRPEIHWHRHHHNMIDR